MVPARAAVIIAAAALLATALACSAAPTQLLDMPRATRLPYNRSRAECYGAIRASRDAVLTALLPHEIDIAAHGLAATLRSLPNLLDTTPADLLFFHTSNWSGLLRPALPAAHRQGAQVACVANDDWAAPRRLEAWEHATGYHSGGYRSMCRFYSRRLFGILHSRGYRWVIRLDSDSELPSALPYNLLDAMAARGAQYGFRAWSVDGGDVTHGLPEAAAYWLAAERQQPAFLYEHCAPPNASGLSSSGGWDRGIVYNNLFVTNVSFWVQRPVQAWLQFLEHTNGFYKFRWGDAPVHTMTLAMFLPREQLLEFGFPYKHSCAGCKNSWGAGEFTSRMPHHAHQAARR
jgi:hypothetical protein